MTITQLRALSGQRIGLPSTFGGTIDEYRALTAAQQVELTRACLAYIKANPGEFTPAQVETATVEEPRLDAVEDTGFDTALFFAELENEAVRTAGSVADIGTGITDSISLIGKLLPVVTLFAIGAVLFIAYQKHAKP